MNKTRLEAFSDNIFAIAVTLLILNVKLPNAERETAHQLSHVLLHVAPNLATFAFSFLVIGSYWIAHHRIFSFVKVVDNTLLWLNIIYLMFIALIPFPAALVTQNPLLPVSIICYTATLLIISIMHFIILEYLLRNNDLKDRTLTSQTYRSAKRIAIVGPICYIVAAIFSFINGYISFAIIILAVLFYMLFAGRSKLSQQLKQANVDQSDREE